MRTRALTLTSLDVFAPRSSGTALITPVAIGISGTIFFAAALGAANPGLMGPQLAALIIPMGALAGVFGRVSGGEMSPKEVGIALPEQVWRVRSCQTDMCQSDT